MLFLVFLWLFSGFGFGRLFGSNSVGNPFRVWLFWGRWIRSSFSQFKIIKLTVQKRWVIFQSLNWSLWGPLGQDLGEVECGNKVKVSCFKRVGYHILIKDDSYLLGELSKSLWFKVSSYCWPLTSFGQINLTFKTRRFIPDVMDTRYKFKK